MALSVFTKRLLLLIGWGASVLIVSAIITVVSLYLLTRQSLKVVQTWKQPDSVKYNSFDPYYLSVVESDTDWRGFPLHVEQRYMIYVGKDEGKPTYGHILDFTFYGPTWDKEELIKKSNVEWTIDGVTLITESGHKVFIPKAMFTGGR